MKARHAAACPALVAAAFGPGLSAAGADPAPAGHGCFFVGGKMREQSSAGIADVIASRPDANVKQVRGKADETRSGRPGGR